MQFVKKGPNVPEKLLQAHEEGNVVFFCGAGISFPAKLPGFGGLVKSLYDSLDVMPTPVQKQALDSEQFDTAISLLEAIRPTIEWRREVRRNIVKLLKPDFSSSKATQTHRSLLQLARTQDNKTRLITTNFDRIFFKAEKEENLEVKSFKAPLLPIPKNRWDGLVYLHGLLPETMSESGLDHLIISSGDFGLAYLTERWAARFVSELFRGYTVCFIGYSLNDPVLRYMMDALAADRILGESPLEMFAFGSFSKGDESSERDQWLAKNVTPILYKMHSNHYYLHETLSKWAEMHRDGLSGKEQIVLTNAIANPSEAIFNNDYVKQMAWALSDPTGMPAKRFSTIQPAPSLNWLFALNDVELNKTDLSRFEVNDRGFDNDLKFNLFSRPAKSSLSPYMSLARNIFNETRWDDIMSNLGNWLVKHLNNPDLVLFIIKQGGILNSQLQCRISRELADQKENRVKNAVEYFDTLKLDGPDAEVSEDMFKVWALLLAGYCEQSDNSVYLYSWVEKYKFAGITVSSKRELRKKLTPKIQFKKPYDFHSGEKRSGLKSLIDWDISLSSSFVHLAMVELIKLEKWNKDCYQLLPEFSGLLRETMELKTELGDVERLNDYSYIHQPSIKAHPQNRDFHDWTALISLCRDSWLSLQAESPEKALNVVNEWWDYPYPIFKRLVFFAATESKYISEEQILKWLNDEESYWMWSVASQREVLQLLRHLPSRLSEVNKQNLQTIVLQGPKRAWFKKELEDEEFENICAREIWLRLAKIKQSGIALQQKSANKYQEISKKNLNWKLSDDQREEFPYWMGDGNDYRSFSASPIGRQELVDWLKENVERDHWTEDDWSQRCKEDFRTTANALLELKDQDIWLTDRWRDGLQAWTDNAKLSKKAWRYLSRHIFIAPNDILVELAWSLSRWLKNKIKAKSIDDDAFFKCFSKLFNLPYDIDIEKINDPLTAAINHPVGILTEALFTWWYNQSPQDGEGLKPRFKLVLNVICESDNDSMVHAKVIIATNLLSLFRVDQNWTGERVVPWLNWRKDVKTASMTWKSFLMSPGLYKGFLVHVKGELLDTAKYYVELGELKEQYARFLTYLALQKYDEYKSTELNKSFSVLPSYALSHVASVLNDGLASSGDKFTEYWEHRVLNFLQKTWPKQAELNEMTIDKLALLCVTSNQFFEVAFNLIRHSLRRIADNEYLTRQLVKSNVIESYPATTLKLLDSVVDEPRCRPATKLRECLDKISSADGSLANNNAYIRLSTLLRRFE